MRLIVLSAGGHARVLIEALLTRNLAPFGVTDIDPAAAEGLGAIPFLGGDDVVESMNPAEVQLVNGCGNRSSGKGAGLRQRRILYERFARKNFIFPPVVHASAVVASSALLEDGAQVMAGAVVQAGVVIGRNAVVNSGAIIEHDCVVGAHSHIAPGTILCGGVTVGEESHIGAGAIVLQGRTVGRGAVIGAGEVIRRNVADNAVLAPETTSRAK